MPWLVFFSVWAPSWAVVGAVAVLAWFILTTGLSVVVATILVRVGASRIGTTFGRALGLQVLLVLKLGHTVGKALDRGHELGQGWLGCVSH
ncbi:unnamed protein product [Arabis nemorensis]|uniref:Uncharacterized protein n=1 Tax=Arabis nemorensis TaxID=586526 RepID=A0A565BTZ0_9BRAS|nr:unnamed protein product [Arabis nemorensis]